MSQLPPIVPTGWVVERLGRGLKLADVRWYLDGRSGREGYEIGHLPGAVFVDLDRVLAAPASARDGRHPLPSPDVFARGLAEVGIGPDDPVVAYDDQGGMAAGRLVWMLRILGSPAALLDGGLQAWDGELATGPMPAPATPADHAARPWPAAALASADEVVTHLSSGGTVVDCRSADRYRGDTEPIDPRAGHLPGAINIPFAGNLDSHLRFRPATELAQRFAAAGADGAAVLYCGSGVSACHNALAMEAAGHPRPRIYVGSWSQWSADPNRPIATGDVAEAGLGTSTIP